MKTGHAAMWTNRKLFLLTSCQLLAQVCKCAPQLSHLETVLWSLSKVIFKKKIDKLNKPHIFHIYKNVFKCIVDIYIRFETLVYAHY